MISFRMPVRQDYEQHLRKLSLFRLRINDGSRVESLLYGLGYIGHTGNDGRSGIENPASMAFVDLDKLFDEVSYFGFFDSTAM